MIRFFFINKRQFFWQLGDHIYKPKKKKSCVRLKFFTKKEKIITQIERRIKSLKKKKKKAENKIRLEDKQT